MSGFRLEKWYFDVSNQTPSAFIGYAARLNYKSFSLKYSGFTLLENDRIKRRNSFTTIPVPEITTDKVYCLTSGSSGVWNPLDSPLEELLLAQDDRKICWECIAPKADAEVTVGGRSYQGLGYAEKLTLTWLPWELPIKHLHWGRFLTSGHTVIWIKWEGTEMRNLIFFNGRRITNGEISESAVYFEDYALTLTKEITLRQGNIDTTVFKRFPSVKRLFPASVFLMEENKWFSGATLFKNQTVVDKGHAIHELVIWH